MSNGNGRWMRRFRPRTPDTVATLYCLPHAGGAASSCLGLAREMDDRVDVVAVQYPGRQDRRMEPLVDDVAELADLLAPVVAEDHDGPFALFGHSMGATLGFELTRRLEAMGVLGLRTLVVSGRRAPSVDRHETVHLLGDAELLDVVERLSGDELPSLGDDPDLIALVLPAIRGDYRAIETYRPTDAVVGVPVVALHGTHDPLTSADDVRAWGRHTDAGLEVHAFPGGHFFLYTSLAEVAGVVAAAVAGSRKAPRA